MTAVRERRDALAAWAAILMKTAASAPAYAGFNDKGVAAINHGAISVADLDKSAHFYEQLFGFKPIPAPVPHARWLVMANGIVLRIINNRRAPLVHDRWDHIALACENLDGIIAALDAFLSPGRLWRTGMCRKSVETVSGKFSFKTRWLLAGVERRRQKTLGVDPQLCLARRTNIAS